MMKSHKLYIIVNGLVHKTDVGPPNAQNGAVEICTMLYPKSK